MIGVTENQKVLISAQLRDYIRNEGYTKASFAKKTGISEEITRKTKKTEKLMLLRLI